jgi:hypothetical protein
MRSGLVERITNRSEFLKRLKFIKVPGLVYAYPRRDALPGMQFRGVNQNYTTLPSVINPQVEMMSIFGGAVQTDTIIIDANGDQARLNEITGSVTAGGLFFDRNVIKGDPTTIPGSFPGLNSRLTGNQLLLAGTNGGNLTLEMVDYLIDLVVGVEEGKILVMNKAVRRNITVLARGTARVTTIESATTQLQFYNGIPMVVLDEDGDQQPILAENETVGTFNTATSMYCMRLGGDLDGEYVQGLVGTNMIVHRDVGLLGTYYLDVVEMLGGIGMFHPRAAARIAGIAVQ